MKAERIQYIDTGRSFGGAERVTLALAGAFRKEGAEVECLVHPQADRFAGELEDRNIPVRRLGEAESISHIGLLASEFRRFRPDVIHIHRTWPLSDRYAAPAALYAGDFRLVTTEHVRFEDCALRDRLSKKLLSLFDRRITCVSEAVRRSLIEFWKISPRRLHVIPNGIDTTRFEVEGEGRYFPPDCPLRIGAVGRLEEQKNFSALLDAMPGILEREPLAMLVIAGEGSQREELAKRAADLGVAKSVALAGSIPDVAPFLAELDLFVLPSLWEGLPLTILEAMAAGCPIVATAVDGTVEALRHGKEALLVAPGDPAGITEACLEVMAGGEEALTRAASARERARRSFSLDVMIEEYRQVYES